jgi:predicted O-methyltransferase YrrM
MSILGNFLRGFFAPPAPATEAKAQNPGEIEHWLTALHQLGMYDLRLHCARELRELLADPRYAAPGRLERYGRKIWSQSDEDGIIEEIFRRIGTASRSFVEFGVGDGRECNTLRLLVEGWRGLWIELQPESCSRIRYLFADAIAQGRLEFLESAVTAENIDRLIAGARVAAAGELDLLSIDIDGNDYHVFRAIECVRPRVVVIEYNAKFPPPMDLVPPYEAGHAWDGSDFMGASLQALANAAARRGYRLVGTNVTGVNAFFVRSDLAADRFADGDAAALYNPARYWLTVGLASGHPQGTRFDYLTDAGLQDLRSK